MNTILPSKSFFSKEYISYLIVWVISVIVILLSIIILSGYIKIETQRTKSLSKLQNVNSKISCELNNNIESVQLLSQNELIKQIIKKDSVSIPFQNDLLNTIKKIFDAQIVYVLNKKGIAIASTEYEEGKTLLGKSYAFRDYFKNSISGNTYIDVAKGVTSNKRGIYISVPIYIDNKIEGVLVKKNGLEFIDKLLLEYSSPVAIYSKDGIIFSSNKSDWILKTTRQLTTQEKDNISKSLRFPNINFQNLPFNLEKDKLINISNVEYKTVKTDFFIDGWNIIGLYDITNLPALSSVMRTMLVIIFIFSFILISFIILLLISKNKLEYVQKELVISGNKYKTLVENSLSPIIYYASNGDVVYVNSAGAEIFNTSTDEILGKNITTFDKDNSTPILDRLANIVTTQKTNYFEEKFKINDSYKVYKSLYQPIFDDYNNIIAIQVISQDITDFVKSENDAYIYKQFAEEAGQGFVICNKNGTIIYSNQAFANMTKLETSKISGKDIFQFYSYNDSLELRKIVNDDFIIGNHKTIELALKTKVGKQISMIQNIFLIQNKLNNNQYFGFIYTDISQRKIIEEKLKIKTREVHKQYDIYRQLNIDLQSKNEKIEIINNELSIANKKIKEANESKNSFLANLSHEMRRSISNIISFSNLIIADCEKNSLNKNYLSVIEDNSHQLSQLLNEILDLSKIEAKRFELSFSEFNLNALLDEIGFVYKEKYKLLDINFSIIKSLDDSKSNIVFDKTRLSQILENVIDNAYKFTNKGFIEVTYTLVCSDTLRFSVKDTGIGIKPGNEERVFDMYSQLVVEDTTKKGTGLGLAICKGILDTCEGKIWFTSEERKGTTFFFEIPFNNQNIASGTNHITSWNNKHLLVVEDDEYNILFITRILEKTGINIEVAKNGENALELLFANPSKFDAILMDMNLPIKNGFDTTREIRNNKITLPIIAQTAYALKGDKNKCLNAGCNDYITKPLKKQALIDILKVYL